ncbi:MAG: HAD family phosphatase [Pirellulales bacterium]
MSNTSSSAPQLGVIFDVDGVLVDSYRAHLQSWQLLAQEHSRQFTEPQFAATFGRTSREIIAADWPDLATSPQAITQLDERKEELYRQIIAKDFPAMDGAIELIDELHSAGISLGVGSSGPPPNVELVLLNLGRKPLFSGIVTGQDVTHGKPHPQVFQTAAQRMNIPPQACVVIEDAAAGIEAAHRAGMKCIALHSPGRDGIKLVAADLIVTTLRQISPEIIARLVTSQKSS